MNKIFRKTDMADLSEKVLFVSGTIERDISKLKKSPKKLKWNKTGADAYLALLEDFKNIQDRIAEYNNNPELPLEIKLAVLEIIAFWKILKRKVDILERAIQKRGKNFIWLD